MPPMMPPTMPGMMGGPPPGMPGMPPQGMGGMPPQGMPNPDMSALESLSGMPNNAKEKEALATASANIQIALAGIYTRSAKASKHLSTAYGEIQKAREELEQLIEAPLQPPPDLLGGLNPSPMGQPQGMF